MNALINQPINFTNTSDTKGETILWFEWDFGDGSTDTSNWDTTHAYTTIGTYIASMTVQTTCGQCTPYTDTINVMDELIVVCDDGPTPNYPTGCDLLLAYDADGDGIISVVEVAAAAKHLSVGTITAEEATFVNDAHNAGSINALCPGCAQRTGDIDPLIILTGIAILGAIAVTWE